MKILVAVASKHGSTEQIAQKLVRELRDADFDVDLRHADEVTSIDYYGAVVLGSAVYIGKWLPEAERFVERFRTRLEHIPVWLFSSGPLGAEDPQPHGDPERLPEMITSTHAREHHIFVGRLDPHDLSLRERLIARLVHAQEGDFRDWDDIRNWAHSIAASLTAAERPRVRRTDDLGSADS
jgi:menaquinone-dependent protoporphyrinogen oxidase